MSKFLLFVLATAASTCMAVSVLPAPKINDSAPDFSLSGVDGKTYDLKQFKGKTVVLEWFNDDCPYVRKYYGGDKAMQKLQTSSTAKGVVWLTIISSAPGKEGFADNAKATKIRIERGMGNTALLLDKDGKVGKMYGAKTTPHMFIINKEGRLVYQGAIDDKPSAKPQSLEGAKNYVSAALTALSSEPPQPIAENSTTPYGCSVKY